MTPKLYKAADVCELTGLQPYVLRSWEKEFPGIGVQKSPDSARLYRQADVDQVLRIKQLVFGEGLTLAGARRRLEDGAARSGDAGGADLSEVLDADTRARIAHVRSGLRSLLDVLSKTPGANAGRDNAREAESIAGTRGETAGEPGKPRAGDRGRRTGTDRRGGPSGTRERRPVAARGKSSAAAERTAPAKRGGGAGKRAAKGKRLF